MKRAKKVLKYKVDLFKADDIHADINELIIENDVLQALLADHLYKLELLTIQKESSSPDSHFTRSPPAKTTLQLQTPTSQKRFLPSTEDSRTAKATPQTPTAQKRFLPSTEHSNATKATVIQLPLQDFQPQTPTARKRFLPSTEDSSAAKATPQTPTARKRFLPSTGSTEDSSTAKDTPLSLMPSKYFVPSTEDSSTGKATISASDPDGSKTLPSLD
ncbi:hypothetical protein BT96DRAFT_912634 [Gymnopus androsaceus JB14]|uniref:Uncharacterized protein n=1 Tax=Gymnopus androsaceus JB14 TaxID=1447944 RepID=A0A6A4IP11_9AGAR|nr:hypothetical protein BT96DRAFT_912634 [Gymnopus androsaceus JB14]